MIWVILIVFMVLAGLVDGLIKAGGQAGHFLEYTLGPFVSVLFILQFVLAVLVVLAVSALHIHKKRSAGLSGPHFGDFWTKRMLLISLYVNMTVGFVTVVFWCFAGALSMLSAPAVADLDGEHGNLVRTDLLERVVHPTRTTFLLGEQAGSRSFKVQFGNATSIGGHWGFVQGQVVFETEDGQRYALTPTGKGQNWDHSIRGSNREDFTPEGSVTMTDAVVRGAATNAEHAHRKVHVRATMTFVDPNFAGGGKFSNSESTYSREFDIIIVPQSDIELRTNWLDRQNRWYSLLLLLVGAFAGLGAWRTGRSGLKRIRLDLREWDGLRARGSG